MVHQKVVVHHIEFVQKKLVVRRQAAHVQLRLCVHGLGSQPDTGFPIFWWWLAAEGVPNPTHSGGLQTLTHKGGRAPYGKNGLRHSCFTLSAFGGPLGLSLSEVATRTTNCATRLRTPHIQKHPLPCATCAPAGWCGHRPLTCTPVALSSIVSGRVSMLYTALCHPSHRACCL